ncbi:VOC family protein [Arthrobacter sp. NEB 688]|uniref:VOC family protein n=1 Tax=Arthrobacter sp. NEB 688 TaxID=904039 RepID=UPI001565CC95|nr:VOC family protein [Arthrobacter sp. NEB 688]QKE84974.1 VOC family protein [Arthrobacter sp. NEB 688]
MQLENVVLDAADPHVLGPFWESLIGGRRITDEPDTVEVRLSPEGAPVLDLCLTTVPERAPAQPRLHLDLLGGEAQEEVVVRALALGARHLDIGQRDVPWVVLADPEGNPFCVMESRPEYGPGSQVAALPLDSADVERDLVFWSALSGWVPASSAVPAALRHPSGHGPLLELCPQARTKPAGEKNRLHLDVRLEGDERLHEAVEQALDLGGSLVEHGWGELPWRVVTDPSGNELCLLPSRG